MTDTLEDLLATSLRGAADTLDATPDVDAALTTGRRQLKHRRMAIGAATLAGVMALPAIAVWSTTLTNGGQGVPLSPGQTSAVNSGEHTAEFTDLYLPGSSGSDARAMDPKSIKLEWFPTSGLNGVVYGEYVRQDGEKLTFQGTCEVPCFVPGPEKTGHGLVIEPANATHTILLGEKSSSSGALEVPISGTTVQAYVERFSDVTDPANISGVIYFTNEGTYGPGNVTIPSHRFSEGGGVQVFASQALDVFGSARPGTTSHQPLSGHPQGIINIGYEGDPKTKTGQAQVAGIIPADATDVTFTPWSGAKNLMFNLHETETIAGGHVFLATWDGAEGDWEQVAVRYTNSKGKRITVSNS